MRNPVPRIAAIHDMSGFGRTSLTVAIPILSCMGIQVCPMPTAVLSTHTVEFTDYTLCDLTPELGGILDHWERLGLHFDGVYSGFMASPEQMDSAARCIRNCLAPGGLAVVDPVLGDNGILDPTMTRKWWKKSLAHLLRRHHHPEHHRSRPAPRRAVHARISPEEIKGRLRRLSAMGPQTVVATSVPLLEGGGTRTKYLGHCLRTRRGPLLAHRLRITPPTTPARDTFSSVLTGSLIQGDSLSIALDRAVRFVTLGIGPRSGKGCPRASILLGVSSAACSRPSRPANAGSWTGTAAVTRCSPSKTDMGSASQRRKSKSRTAGRPGRERSIRYNGMGQRIC
ncbi:MAG: pyridoxamine kinase [Bilophila wadsworthia]